SEISFHTDERKLAQPGRGAVQHSDAPFPEVRQLPQQSRLETSSPRFPGRLESQSNCLHLDQACRSDHPSAPEDDCAYLTNGALVIVTWGPDGGYGHPDHRLVSDAVTQVVQSLHSNIKLYYPGLSPAQAKSLYSIGPSFLKFHTVDPAYLTVNVSYTKQDEEKFKDAFECHKSQFTPERFQALEKAMDEGWHGTVSLR